MAILGRALVVAAVWLSPAAFAGMTALLLADGTQGLFAPVGLGGGAVLAAAVLGTPFRRFAAGGSGLVGLARRRWPASRFAAGLLGIPVAGVAFLLLWAQLAAWREVAEAARWPPGGAVGILAALLAVAALWKDSARWLAISGAGVGCGGLALSLVVVMAATDPAWPRVWAEVAARTRVIFTGESPWTDRGQPLSGAGPVLWLPVTEEHRLGLLGRGPVLLEGWDGTWSRREVRSDTNVTLHAGDRLGVPNGFRVRFETGRAVPGAPSSGAAWLDPPGSRGDWRALAGLGLTLLAGAVGLAPAHAALAARGPAGPGAARLGAGLVVLGGVGVALWTLYAVWLTPEIYTGGALAFEVYELPGRVQTLGWAAELFGTLALLAIGGGVVAASCASLDAVAGASAGLGGVRLGGLSRVPIGGRGGELVWLALLAAAALALTASVGPWSLVLAAFGLAASTLAPAAVLVCWREGLSPRAVVFGAGVGGLLFATLWALGAVPARGAGATSWLAWLVAWPGVLAVPANVAVTWLASPRAVPAGRGALPPDLATLHDDS